LQPIHSDGSGVQPPSLLDAAVSLPGAPARRSVRPAVATWTGDARGPAEAMPVPGDVPEVEMAERSEFANRALNVVIAGIALMLLAPLCVVVALLVKLTSKGPVFYTQTRIGLDRRWQRTAADDADRRVEDLGGQPFTILKFRSMTVDAEKNGQAVWAAKHDARVTAIGRILRKTRIDEIPQLVNVLRGEMNIVGPRPERPSIVVRLRESIPEYTQRHRVKPGITGWAQINHSYDSCIEDVKKKVEFDLEYIASQGVWTDLKIMLLTLPVMVFRKGAH
jgi:lipopolysaccharide/colanic/teichoic acid biosynthesis glycosyltransferase